VERELSWKETVREKIQGENILHLVLQLTFIKIQVRNP